MTQQSHRGNERQSHDWNSAFPPHRLGLSPLLPTQARSGSVIQSKGRGAVTRGLPAFESWPPGSCSLCELAKTVALQFLNRSFSLYSFVLENGAMLIASKVTCLILVRSGAAGMILASPVSRCMVYRNHWGCAQKGHVSSEVRKFL